MNNVFGYVVSEGSDRNATALEHSKQQRRNEDAYRVVAAQQRHSNTSEAIVIRKAVVITIAITKHFVDPNHAGQSSGYCHRNDNLFPHRDAAILSRAGIRSG